MITPRQRAGADGAECSHFLRDDKSAGTGRPLMPKRAGETATTRILRTRHSVGRSDRSARQVSNSPPRDPHWTDSAARAPLLVISGELDHRALRADAFRLVDAAGNRSELLSDEPGIEPAPQLPVAREVDAHLTTWFRRHLADAHEPHPQPDWSSP